MANKSLVEKVANDFSLTKKLAGEVIDSVFSALGEEIKTGEKVRITGLGTFGLKAKPARTGRNPKTGEDVAIPAKTVVTFKVGKELKDAVK